MIYVLSAIMAAMWGVVGVGWIVNTVQPVLLWYRIRRAGGYGRLTSLRSALFAARNKSAANIGPGVKR